MRVALYARVSTEDQARYGLSIDAQLAALREWATKNGHEIAGEYVDAGISGKKPYTKRPALLRFMRDLETGDILVNALVFTKLDRFYRSVKLYYQAVDILDRHHVAWIAIQEDYETATAGGRMKVNIMLSVAENEADRTAERIKTVFDRKIQLGQPVTRSQPLGFALDSENKRLVHDENAPAALAAFEHFAMTGNYYSTRQMIQDDYGVRVPYEAVYRMLRNPLYIGSYRGNDQFCEPIVPRALWDKVQHDIATRTTRRTATGHVYLFAGLIVCAECGRKYIGNPGGKELKRPETYRCPGHYMGNACPQSRTIREYKLEEFLVKHVAEAVRGKSVEVKTPQKKKTPVNRAAITAKLERLKELYIEGDIDKDEYRTQRDALSAKLQEPEPPKSDGLLKIVGDDFEGRYANYTREQKKLFWRSCIDHIDVDLNMEVRVYFVE